MKIINFGSCNIDYVYSVNNIVVPGETIGTYSLELFPGGKGLNQSIAAARAGGEVYHAGCVGADGEMLMDILKSSGVDVSNIKMLDEKNGHAIIQVSKSGENSILLYGGSNRMVTKEYIDDVLSRFEKGDIVLLQNETSNVQYVIKKAYEKGMKIVLNPAPFDNSLKDIDFNMLSYVILNEVEAKGFTGKDNSSEILAALKKDYPNLKVVLTLGKSGCIYSDSEQTISHPAFIVEAVDTTAAGDTFIGYFLSALTSRKTCEEAVKLASAASALTVSKKGAAPSIPELKDVVTALKTLKPYSAGNKQEQMKKVINDYIKANVTDANIIDLANILGYSKTYTSELVKKVLNKPFTEAVQENKCAVAAKLLLETDLSVSQIINKVGYENESFFRKKFKDLYGKTPLQYRK